MFKTCKKMNLPNKITILRIIMVPIFVTLMTLDGLWEYMKYVALGVYLLATLSDYVDGMIARKKGLITNFGKLMDPLADKILVAAGFIMLTEIGIVPAWITFVMIGRDLFMNTIRMFAVGDGVTISAGISGKIKTAFQLVGVSLGIIATQPIFAFIENGTKMNLFELSTNAFMSISIVAAMFFTLLSCINYTVKNMHSIDFEN